MGTAAAVRRRRWLRFDRSTTPGRLRLLLGGLVLLSLAWGALAGFTASHYSSAANSVVSVREPLSVEAEQIYWRLSDANDAAATAFLTGGLEPPATRDRYLADIGDAGSAIEQAAAQGGAGSGPAATDLRTLATELPLYTGEIETARADNRLGLPLGAAYLREASALMRGTLLPAAQGMFTAENASLDAASAQATAAPLVDVTLIVGIAVCVVMFVASLWLSRRTRRTLNVGLLVAGAAAVISLGWLATAWDVGRGDLQTAQSQGSAPVEALARVSIAAQQAHTDESLTLIDNTGDDAYQADYLQQQTILGPGPGTLLTAAQLSAAASPAAAPVSDAIQAADAWFGLHSDIRATDDSGDHVAAVQMALSTASGYPGWAFAQLSDDLTAGITLDQAVFQAQAQAGVGAFSGLEPGVIAAALVMAVGCAWGLSRRLAEYR